MMRRDLATVLDELRDGLVQSGARAGVRVTGVEMTLPVDLLVVLRDGGVSLLADVTRSRSDTPVSRLHVRWALAPAEPRSLAPGHGGEGCGEGAAP